MVQKLCSLCPHKKFQDWVRMGKFPENIRSNLLSMYRWA